ncbi:MAG: hypothetical protein K6L75_15300 [Cellvibrionaceae bacterium]
MPKITLLARHFSALVLFLSAGILSCSLTQEKKIISKNYCNFININFDNNFSGARLNSCQKIDPSHFLLTIKPENVPINDSPWYAFKVNSSKNQIIKISLKFINGTPRYRPKVSKDGKIWKTVPYLLAKDTIHFSLPIKKETLWIAGQEIITNTDYQKWTDSISKKKFVEIENLGSSVNGQSISAVRVNKENKDVVVIIGRQHPPEITGALALFSFVETLLSDSHLAVQFRQRFQTLVIPNVNPDGVGLGHWRHNANGVDTNRDWGLFTQPETIEVKKHLDSLSQDHTFYLGLDFHSTGKNYFYTQKDTDPLCPQEFTTNWIQHISEKRPDFLFNRSKRSSNGNPTFKQWFNTEYAVPSISYEMGDNTDRELIKDIAKIAAEEMMRELLASRCQ